MGTLNCMSHKDSPLMSHKQLSTSVPLAFHLRYKAQNSTLKLKKKKKDVCFPLPTTGGFQSHCFPSTEPPSCWMSVIRIIFSLFQAAEISKFFPWLSQHSQQFIWCGSTIHSYRPAKFTSAQILAESCSCALAVSEAPGLIYSVICLPGARQTP